MKLKLLHKTLLGFLLLFFFIISSVLFVEANVYMWKDKAGNIHVTQTSPPKGAKLIKKILDATPTPVNSKSKKTHIRKKKKKKNYIDIIKGHSKKLTPTPKPTVKNIEPTPIKDKFGHDAQWWKKHRITLEKDLQNAKSELTSVKNNLRSLNQGHRRPNEVDNLRKKQTKLKNKIKQLENELEDLEISVVKSGGQPGWVR